MLVPVENQFRFENTHEAIIDKETWNIVQKVREGRRRITKSGNINKYSGLLYCADCGVMLTYNSGNKQSQKAITLCAVPTADTRTAIVYCRTESVKLY